MQNEISATSDVH